MPISDDNVFTGIVRDTETAHNVRAYGAVPDGVTDSTPAILEAIAEAGSGGSVLFPPGIYRITATLTGIYDEQTWIMHGATILVDFSGIGIQIGQDASVRTRRIRIFGGKVIRNGSTAWVPGEVGVQFVNTNYCLYEGFEIRGFEKGFSLLGSHGQGQAYLTAIPIAITGCKFPIHMYMQDGGWCNENSVIGNGSISYASSDPDATGGYAIYMGRASGNAFVMNGNKVMGVSLESAKSTGKPSGAIFCDASMCTFVGLRYEGFEAPFITLGASAASGGNAFAWGRGLTTASECVDSTASGSLFHFHGGRGVHIGGGSPSAPILTLAEVNSNNNVALRVARTDGSTVYEVGSDGKVAIGNGGGEIARTFSGTAPWAPSSIAAGASAETDVTIPGAAVGDIVGVGFSSLTGTTAAQWGIQAAVRVSNTVRVRLTNHTGGPVTLPSGTLKVVVTQI